MMKHLPNNIFCGKTTFYFFYRTTIQVDIRFGELAEYNVRLMTTSYNVVFLDFSILDQY